MVAVSYFHWQKNSERIEKQHKIMMSDLRWAQWQAPVDTEKYIRLWLFKQDHNAKILSSKIVDIHNRIKHCEIEIESENPEKIIASIQNIPFGRAIVSMIDQNQMRISWYWSEELKTKEKLPKLDDVLVVSLESIMMLDGAEQWKVKINNTWIDNASPVLDNIEVVEVRHQAARLRIKLPRGEKIVELQCGNEVKVDYWDVS